MSNSPMNDNAKMKRKLNDDDVPEPVSNGVESDEAPAKASFANFGLDPRLLQAVNKSKFSTPTPVQTKAIPLALSGKDVLARSKTGSGKTLAYILPILHSILRRKSSTTATTNTKHTSALLLVPTKELATQVASTLKTFTAFCSNSIRSENITRKEDAAVTRARLAEHPDVVVATPSRASKWVEEEALKLDDLKHVIVDEADLVLNYGYEDDLRNLASLLPAGTQTIMMSATLRTETDTLTSLFCKSSKPTILDLSAEEAAEEPKLAQYVVRTAEEDKFLLIYAVFKLQLIKGKVIIFVADVDRCYRVKLFLEQFGIRSCVLNEELPINSRQHTIEEFNKGVYDIIIAADEAEVVGEDSSRKKRKIQQDGNGDQDEHGEEEQQTEETEATEGAPSNDISHTETVTSAKTAKSKAQNQPKRRRNNDPEHSSSRGIDFHAITCVLNFDLPTSAKSYTHRTGRTARAGQTGMALSFYVPKELYRKHKPTSIPQCEGDEAVLAKIRKQQAGSGMVIGDWEFDMKKLEGFRYRFQDALRSVTRIAVREARTKELRNEVLNSEKLKRHFEENPEELRHLRHDRESHAIRSRGHLKHVPEYLLPQGGKAAVREDVGFVGLRRDTENRIRKRRELNKGKGRGRMQRGKGLDPLRSLNVGGRGKK